jgi:hypothetical protein
LQLSNRSSTEFLASLKNPPPFPLTNGTTSTASKSTANEASSHSQAVAYIKKSSSFINDDEDEIKEHKYTASSSKIPNEVQQKSKKSTKNKRHSDDDDDDEPYVAPAYITSKQAKTTRLTVSDVAEPASNNHRVRFKESVEACSTETYSV